MAHVPQQPLKHSYDESNDQYLNWKKGQLWLDAYRALVVSVVFVPSALLRTNLNIVWLGYLPYLVVSLVMVFLSWKGITSRIRFWIFLVIDAITINVFGFVIGLGTVPIGIAMIPTVLAYTTAGGPREGMVSSVLILGLFALILVLENQGILEPNGLLNQSLPAFTSPGGRLGAWAIISGVLLLTFLWIANLMKNLDVYKIQILHAYDEEQRVLKRSAKLSRALRQSEKLEGFGKLAGSVAHDFNSLLTVIRGFTDEILEKNHNNKALESDLQEIIKASSRASELTAKLLAFSKLQDVEAQALEVNQLIRDFQRLLSPIIGEDISVEINLFRKPIWINGDPKRIEQVLMALAVNSKDAMPEGGTITISTRKLVFGEVDTNKPPALDPGQYLEIAFSDDGVGMSREVHSRAFEPFFTTKAQGEGSGLGLSVVYGIVKQHAGEVRAETKEGQGTTIKLFIPAIPEWSGV